MLLGNLLKSTNKNYRKIPVKGISFDSRKIKKKDVFFAIKGNQTSGIKFINDALSKGASAIVSSEKIKYVNHKTPLILVKSQIDFQKISGLSTDHFQILLKSLPVSILKFCLIKLEYKKKLVLFNSSFLIFQS